MFDYQLIFKQGRVHEKRKLLSGDSNALEREFVWGLIVSYLNERAVFGPQTLLSEERQKRFVFDFKRISDVDTHALMEIQFTPREGGSEFFDSGTVWVDCRDFSVRRIRVIPRYIRGYEKLQRQAERYKVRLVLTCEIYYDRFYEDVYFPSRVIISESYQGGPVLGGTVGAKGFERSKTTYQYDRYRFFKINTRVKVE